MVVYAPFMGEREKEDEMRLHILTCLKTAKSKATEKTKHGTWTAQEGGSLTAVDFTRTSK